MLAFALAIFISVALRLPSPSRSNSFVNSEMKASFRLPWFRHREIWFWDSFRSSAIQRSSLTVRS